MIELTWDDFYNVVPEFHGGEMKLGTLTVAPDETLDFGGYVGKVHVSDLGALITQRTITAGWSFRPQLAMLVFQLTRKASVINTYFPLTNILDKTEQKAFYQLAGEIISQSNFKCTLVTWYNSQYIQLLRDFYAWSGFSENPPSHAEDSTTGYAAEIAFFIACHIAEIFFYQRPILEHLLTTPFEIRLATSPEAFKKDGGVAGGCFNAEKRTIQLVLSRLFEGYRGKTPGVAPFLHEFGHLLDHFDVKAHNLTESHGTLPGMRPGEGKTYNPQAQRLFLKGKQLEWQRYMHLHENGYHDGDVMPVGHPYVFQNDGEFIAGYLEMFFRNPHTFAAQNPDLFDSFVLTFGYDPRKAWEKDFPFYIEQNQKFYREHRPPKPGITI